MTDPNNSRRTTTGRDLRFAGTIAAGLVAGVLGFGAIAVPLVGWNKWPAPLSSSSGKPITISTATDRSPERDSDGSTVARPAPRPTISGPTGALALLPATGGSAPATTGSGAGTGAAGTGADGTGTPGGDAPSGARRSSSDVRGSGGGSEANEN